MSKASNYVKAWRKNSKKRIIESMGGSCVICGYNKCQSGLALHHLDPKSKDFGLGAVRANIKSWNKIAEELKKCILVCHNCHSEIHENLIKIPSDVKRFNENFIEYKKIKTSLCKMCKIEMSNKNIYCSNECLNKSKCKVNWSLIDLKKELETKSITQISEELGISYNAVAKRIKKYNTN